MRDRLCRDISGNRISVWNGWMMEESIGEKLFWGGWIACRTDKYSTASFDIRERSDGYRRNILELRRAMCYSETTE